MFGWVIFERGDGKSHKRDIVNSGCSLLSRFDHLCGVPANNTVLRNGFNHHRPGSLRCVPLPKLPGSGAGSEENRRTNSASNPTRDILTRDGWHIVITNVGEELMETSEIAQLYSVRWQIEIIFRPGSSPVNLSRPSQGPAIRFIWRRSCMGPYYC